MEALEAGELRVLNPSAQTLLPLGLSPDGGVRCRHELYDEEVVCSPDIMVYPVNEKWDPSGGRRSLESTVAPWEDL